MAMTKPHFQAEKDKIVQQDDGNYLINPRGLSIVWGNDERYWKIPKETGPDVAAELVQVSWLEVTGSVELKPGKYELTFEVELTPDAFGWKDIKAFLMAKVGKKGRYKWTRVQLQPEKRGKYPIPDPSDPGSQKLSIDVDSLADNQTLYFGLYEVWSGKWKGGLKIYNAKVTKINTSTVAAIEVHLP